MGIADEDWKDLRSPCIPSSTSLNIEGTWGQMNILQADTLFLFLSSSCLEYFTLSLLDVQGAGDRGLMPSSQSLDIVSIFLTRTSCESLKTLIYEIDSDSPDLVEPSDPAAILKSQTETLEFIIIESFALFTNLQHLEIEQCLLTHNPKIPDSLRHLVIRACEYPVARLLTNLAECSFDSLRFSRHTFILYPSASRSARRRLRNIILEACFDVDVRCQEWILFKEGLL
ncbi:hypothetical protein V8F44DRAFT_637174 [Aspergillus fumigatus]